MICRGCSRELLEGQKFCPGCGMKNELIATIKNAKRCVGCGREFQEDRTYCDTCGGKLKLIIPSVQTLHNEIPQNQAQQGQVPPPTQQQPYSMPPTQQQPYRIPPTQQQPYWIPPIQQQPNRISPIQQQPYGMPLNSMPRGPMIPGMLYPQPVPRKNNTVFIVIIILVSVLFFLIAGIFALYVIGESVIESSETTGEVIQNDSSDYNAPDNGDNDTSTDFGDDSGTGGDNSADYADNYSYSELPDVLSLDSDDRFVYYDYDTYDGVATYTYLFDSVTSSDADFYSALSDYCQLLQSSSGFYYDADFSINQYNATGVSTEYLTKNNICIGVTASVTDSLYYTYITLVFLSE